MVQFEEVYENNPRVLTGLPYEFTINDQALQVVNAPKNPVYGQQLDQAIVADRNTEQSLFSKIGNKLPFFRSPDNSTPQGKQERTLSEDTSDELDSEGVSRADNNSNKGCVLM